MAIFHNIAWNWVFYYFSSKQKARIHDLSFYVFWQRFLFFIPIVIEFSLLTRIVLWELFLYHFTGGFMLIGEDAFL